jgi:hypothetical protein
LAVCLLDASHPGCHRKLPLLTRISAPPTLVPDESLQSLVYPGGFSQHSHPVPGTATSPPFSSRSWQVCCNVAGAEVTGCPAAAGGCPADSHDARRDFGVSHVEIAGVPQWDRCVWTTLRASLYLLPSLSLLFPPHHLSGRQHEWRHRQCGRITTTTITNMMICKPVHCHLDAAASPTHVAGSVRAKLWR